MQKVSVFWFRRDLRLQDNAGLYHALKSDFPVLPLFIFDTEILDDLEDKQDARVHFIHQELKDMHEKLLELGSSMVIKHGNPTEVWKGLTDEFTIAAVYANRDYEPYAKRRDTRVEELLGEKNIPFRTFKDQVIFEKDEILKSDGDPYTVFTPYSRKWLAKLQEEGVENCLPEYNCEPLYEAFYQTKPLNFPSLQDIGFSASDVDFPPKSVKKSRIKNYEETRNFPGIQGTSRLSVHFRFGTVSIREKAKKAIPLSKVYLNELIWRDFYSMILAHFPRVVEQPFREKYNFVEWRDASDEFQKWCEGKTGYPIVDAGMRQLNAIGYMHNRVRMVTASFLTKHLLIDWRLGEAYFAKKLLDYDLASNNGGWQWAAGCGTDAAPYFRIFNPESQQKKFDKDFKYIKKWVPEFGTDDYPEPIVEHKFARERCLTAFKTGLDKASKVMNSN